MIGEPLPTESRWVTDPDSGREVLQLTSAGAHSYPLYYFMPSVTSDGRYLVLHSERSGLVQLYRLDLTSGELARLTDGQTSDAGWAVWCEWHVAGIYNHLSALDQRGVVYYFQDQDIRATSVRTFDKRVVASLPDGQLPIGQSAVSPDGSLLAFIHTDARRYADLLRRREAAEHAGTFRWEADHHSWFRNSVETTLSVVDVASGQVRPVMTTDFHFHHVLFANDHTLLVNHPKSRPGLWQVSVGGRDVGEVRPPEADDAHGASIVHQVVTERGLAYEAVCDEPDGSRSNYLGRYDLATGEFSERLLPVDGYVHVGRDPAGRFSFVEHASSHGHELLAVAHRRDSDELDVTTLRRLRSPAHDHQRFHAHPFLSPDRMWMFFTDWCDRGFSQVHAMRVDDLTHR